MTEHTRRAADDPAVAEREAKMYGERILALSSQSQTAVFMLVKLLEDLEHRIEIEAGENDANR